MPKYKNLIIASRVATAGRRRKCYHDPAHRIQKGQLCLEVKETLGWKGYCLVCAARMLSNASGHISTLEHDLRESATPH